MSKIGIGLIVIALMIGFSLVSAQAKDEGCGEAPGWEEGTEYKGSCEELLDDPIATPIPEPVAMPQNWVTLLIEEPDTDQDGCPDETELSDTATSGGLRDPYNHWDYFNPTKDGLNRADDILAVIGQYFIDKGNPLYTEETDRTSIIFHPDGTRADPWDAGPPNGQQRVDDMLMIMRQYFHDCSNSRALRGIKQFCDERDVLTAQEAMQESAGITAQVDAITAGLPETPEGQIGGMGDIGGLAEAEPAMVTGGESYLRCIYLSDESGENIVLREILTVELLPGAGGKPELVNQECHVSRRWDTIVSEYTIAEVLHQQDWGYLHYPGDPNHGMILTHGPPMKTDNTTERLEFAFTDVIASPGPTNGWQVPGQNFLLQGAAETVFRYGTWENVVETKLLVGMDTCFAW